jgi:hypothetical protein
VKGFLVIVGAVTAILAVASYVLLVGPRMYDQPHIRAFQAVFPPMPEGTVPVEDPTFSVPSAEAAAVLTNPLSSTPENLEGGKACYLAYCVACHGDAGDGNGPVGESYVPKPSDLREAKIRAYADGQLMRAMLLGTGHEPVLGRVVHPQYRWSLVLYVRALGRAAP